VHFAFWLFVIVRDMTSTGRDVDMGILGGIFILFLFGPVTAAQFAVGYALFDVIAGTVTGRSAVRHRYNPMAAGLVAGLLLFVGLSLGTVFPNLSNNLADSYLGGRLAIRTLWGPILLGALSGALTAAVGIALNWGRRGPAAT
jgi:hypothetical protein